MKIFAAIFFTLFLMLGAVYSFSQEKTEIKDFEQTIQSEVTSYIISFNLNYNYIITTTHKTRPYLGFGLQYLPHSISNENVFMLYPQVGLLIGKTYAFEASGGVLFDFKYREHIPTLYTGYRYLSNKTHFNFKVGLTLFYLGKSEPDAFFKLPMFFPSPTVGFGFRW